MIKPDHIPDAVADSMREFFHTRGDAQKAIAAALNAWPGMHFIGNIGVHLPLSTEASDGQ